MTEISQDSDDAPNPPVAGVCSGFEIRSHLPFNYLRAGTGHPMEVVESAPGSPAPIGELISEASPRLTRGSVDVYRTNSGFNIEVDYAGWFHVDPGPPRISVPPTPHTAWREAVTWGLPLALCVMIRGDLMLHSAAVEIDGRAIILGAPGGYGKTTLIAAFVRRGFRLLSEDLTACTVEPSPTVYPGPALIRVRRDVAENIEIPGTHLVAEDQEKLHLGIDPDLIGSGEGLPLGAVVLLRETQSGVSIDRVPSRLAIPDLWRLAVNLPDDAGRTRCFHLVSELAASTPIWNLHRPLVYGELDRVVEVIASQTLAE
jgi:hypothetical protein